MANTSKGNLTNAVSAVNLLATDRPGSPLSIITREELRSRTYTAYGHHEPIHDESNLGYTGQRQEPGTGHYMLGTGRRAFNPVLMRFNSPDALSPFSAGGLNAYAYCGGDPVNFIDPSGQFAVGTAIARGLANWLMKARVNILYKRAPAAKSFIDDLAGGLAQKYNGKVIEAPLKLKSRTLEKVSSVHQGDPGKMNDIARNTLVVDSSSTLPVAGELSAQGHSVKIIGAHQTPVGYSGVHATIRTPIQMPAEMQVHTPQMIFANQPPHIAEAALGTAKFRKLTRWAQMHGYKGGQGHKYFETHRDLNKSIRQRETAAGEGRDYYNFIQYGFVHL